MVKRYDLVVHSVIMDITVCRRKLSLFLVCFVVVVAVIIVVGCLSFFSFFFFSAWDCICQGLFKLPGLLLCVCFIARIRRSLIMHNSVNLEFLSFNVRGIRDLTKTFSFLKDLKASIHFR